MEYKICSKCNKKKEITIFVKNKQCKGGYAGICKECSNFNCTNWKRKNSIKIAKRRREIYANTKGFEVKQREIKRKLAYPIRCRAQILRMGMRERSKKLKIPFDSHFFTVSYLMKLLEEKPYCECCRIKLDIGFKLNGQPNNFSPSIDKKIPSRGYTKENAALLCWRCNNLKRDATVKELQTIINWINSWGNEV